jgi:hypothetical protein
MKGDRLLKAGVAKIDITPTKNVWMDGMIRSHPSVGVHDALFARALVLSNDEGKNDFFVIVSVDVCVLNEKDAYAVREVVASRTGIPANHIIVAATHTHSGPATIGFFNPAESGYIKELVNKMVTVIEQAVTNVKPVAVGVESGKEETISHYRRLLADNGRVVMNWEPYPSEHIVGPLGVVDTEVGVLKVVDTENPEGIICLLFNHAGHPNVMSGDNYLLSADYPGVAVRLLEKEFGGVAMFLNGAQGTMDIDGLKHRDWEGMEKAGKGLSKAVAETARKINLSRTAILRGAALKYTIPSRKITDLEWSWAERVLSQTGGAIQPMADGVGDDYKALLYKKLREVEEDVEVEQICFAIDCSAFISFPGELFTEIGMQIKKESPFSHTYIVGLANGGVGYIPTRKAIKQGGYEVDMRLVAAEAEDIIIQQSLSLLRGVYKIG